MISSSQITLLILLLAWLLACIVYDLRSRQVPPWLTIPPLILASCWRTFHEGWPMVFLVIALILISDLPQVKWRIPLAGFVTLWVVLTARSPDLICAMLVIFAVWVLWETGATGGADAKIIISLVLLFGDGWLFLLILLAGGIQGLLGLIARRKTIPYTVAIGLGTAAWLWVTVGH